MTGGKRAETAQRKKAVLAAFLRHGTVYHACRAAKVERARHYEWLKKDAQYRAAFEEAQQSVADTLEREAIRRGRTGWLEPVFYKGQVCARVRKWSDTLLIFMLKALRPEKYRERTDHRLEAGATLEDILARLYGGSRKEGENGNAGD